MGPQGAVLPLSLVLFILFYINIFCSFVYYLFCKTIYLFIIISYYN